jgi:hypothetical protein
VCNEIKNEKGKSETGLFCGDAALAINIPTGQSVFLQVRHRTALLAPPAKKGCSLFFL